MKATKHIVAWWPSPNILYSIDEITLLIAVNVALGKRCYKFVA